MSRALPRPRPRCHGQSHWITSSARASTAGGIVRPRAFAVFRLITNSNLVGCSMGDRRDSRL